MRVIATLVAGLAFVSAPLSSQTVAPAYRTQAGQIQQADAVLPLAPDGSSAALPIRVTSTSTAATIATANTFQSALVSNANRKGCAIYNTSSAAMLIFLGAPGSATAATSIPLPAAGSFNCGSFQGLVLTDQISITSATAGSTFVVVAQ